MAAGLKTFLALELERNRLLAALVRDESGQLREALTSAPLISSPFPWARAVFLLPQDKSLAGVPCDEQIVRAHTVVLEGGAAGVRRRFQTLDGSTGALEPDGAITLHADGESRCEAHAIVLREAEADVGLSAPHAIFVISAPLPPRAPNAPPPESAHRFVGRHADELSLREVRELLHAYHQLGRYWEECVADGSSAAAGSAAVSDTDTDSAGAPGTLAPPRARIALHAGSGGPPTTAEA